MRLAKLLFILIVCVAVPFGGAAAKDFTVVIDAGHGGRDAGALGLRTNEKEINLNVAQKLRKLILDNMDDARVEMTRDKDVFVTLQGRADFANHKHADVFISIHANSLDRKSPTYRRVNGAAVYTLGLDRSDTNLSVAMRENAVMKMEDDYTTVYEGFDPSSTESYIAFEMMQHKNMDQSVRLAEAVQNQLVRTAGRKNNGVRQAPFWVLVRTSMPAILVELDFISNPRMEKFMASDEGSSLLATAIYNGLRNYRNRGGKPTKVTKPSPTPAKAVTDTTPTPSSDEPKVSAEDDDRIVYKIQFMTAPTLLKEGHKSFKGLTDVDHYKDGGTYKYTVGAYGSQAEAAKALPKVKAKFGDAFVIKTRGGKRIK
ncbi:MAG: N-acetylmuramoyl-L-alanine amidase [Duncaniella sp.]|nr:N-acetylmuramoyl-L-alanine amidase [Duncaniella sp.]